MLTMKSHLFLKKNALACIFTPLSISSLFAQDFYDINKIQEIKLYFSRNSFVK